MKLLKYAVFFPWVLIGSLIGSAFVVPMVSNLIDKFYYKEKYNKNTAMFYKQYKDNSYIIKVSMPNADSKLYYIMLIEKSILYMKDLIRPMTPVIILITQVLIILLSIVRSIKSI